MLIRIGSASDVPFEFSDSSLNLASYSSAQLEEESALSQDLNGVPVITMPSNSEILEIPVTGGGSTSEGKLKKKVADLKHELNKKVEPDNPQINDIAVKLAAKYPGDLRIDQICEIYYYLKYGDDAKSAWRYVRDIRGIDSWKYANSSIKMGSDIGCVGLGDCDDFAILMSALVESIGGATRIVLASNNTVGGHAYTEVYLGQLDDPNNQAEEIIQWLREEYDNEKIFGHVDTDTKEAWLNLDWGPDSKGNAHPGGPLFKGDDHYVLRVRDEYKLIPLRMPEAANMPPRLSSLTPDQASPQEAGSVIVWTAKAKDPEDDKILYRFLLNGYAVTRWISDSSWEWITTEADIGDNQVEVQIRDGKHKGPNSFDGNKVDSYLISEQETEEPAIPIDQSRSGYPAAENGEITNETVVETFKPYGANPEGSSNSEALKWYNEGIALEALGEGKYNESILAYEKAIEIDPNFSWPWNAKGGLLMQMGRYDEALQAYDKAIEIDPLSAVAWYNKGTLLYYGFNRTAEAGAAYAKATDLGY